MLEKNLATFYGFSTKKMGLKNLRVEVDVHRSIPLPLEFDVCILFINDKLLFL